MYIYFFNIWLFLQSFIKIYSLIKYKHKNIYKWMHFFIINYVKIEFSNIASDQLKSNNFIIFIFKYLI